MHTDTDVNAKTRGPPAPRPGNLPLPARRHSGGLVASANPRGQIPGRQQTSLAEGPAVTGWPGRDLGPARFISAATAQSTTQNLKEMIITMEIIRNDNNNPLSQAEMKASQQFEASPLAGQVLFHPQVADGQPAPNCVAFLEEVGRFGVTILEDRYTVEGRQWFQHQADGARSHIDKPLEGVWQAAKAVREELNRNLDLNTYVIAVAWFPDMDEDEDILDEVGDSQVRLLFGQADLAQRLVHLPKERQLQTHLSRRYIQRDVEVLSRAPAVETPAPAGEEPQSVNGRAGALTFQHVDTVNIYVTVVNGSVGDDPSLITVQGQ